MAKLNTIFLLGSLVYSTIFALDNAIKPEFELTMDCGKKEAYAGEKLVCQFVLAAPYDYVDVEVVKFPEFRGYWSENLALRQGPIGLMPISTPMGFKKLALIGSYSIYKMVDTGPGEIIPMKVSVKPAGLVKSREESRDSAQFILSKPNPIRWLALPPLPKTAEAQHFNGAVGQFSSTQAELSVSYRLEEPIQLRIGIQGRGNFAEINTIPLNLPEGLEVLSHRTFVQNSGDNSSKTFDYSVLLKNSPPPSIELGSFIFFDPEKRTYQTLTLPKVLFSLAPIAEKGDSISFLLPPPEPYWSHSVLLLDSPFFWAGQVAILTLMLGFYFRNWKREKHLRYISSSEFRRNEMWNRAISAHQHGAPQVFTQIATTMFTELLSEKIKSGHIRLNYHPTKNQSLALVKNSLTQEQVQVLTKLFESYDQSFSPSKTPPNPALADHLKQAFKIKVG